MKATILIIEDNPDVRENIQELLQLYGYDAQVAEDGKQGVIAAKEIRPDLIICDIMMPGLDGYGVLQILSRQPETSSIPFIFLTAKSEGSDVRKGMSMGADDYITKPFEESVLLQAIEVRLDKFRKWKQLIDEGGQNGWNRLIETAHGMDKLKDIADRSVCRHYHKKEIIFQQDDRPLYLFQIVTGKVKIYQVNNEGKEITAALLKAGDYFGYESLLKGQNQGDAAETLEDSEIRLIPREDFLNLIFNDKEVSSAFIKMMSNDITERERHLLELAYNTVRKRVADALVKIYDTYAEKSATAYSMSISRDDLASIVGTSSESAIRMLSEFKTSGFIDIKGSEITILEVEKLRKAPY